MSSRRAAKSPTSRKGRHVRRPQPPAQPHDSRTGFDRPVARHPRLIKNPKAQVPKPKPQVVIWDLGFGIRDFVKIAAGAALPQPHTTFKSGGATFRFYLGDSVDLLGRLAAGSISAIVTSLLLRQPGHPLPDLRGRAARDRYLGGPPNGSAPRGPMPPRPTGRCFSTSEQSRPTRGRRSTSRAARPHLQLQNTIHWIESISPSKGACRRAGGD